METISKLDSIAFYEPEGNLIPFYLVKILFEAVPYASDLRVFFQLLHQLGCRICEVTRMKRSLIKGNFIYWKLGKNQKSWRKEFISTELIEEIDEYRRTHRVYSDRILGPTHVSLSQYFIKMRHTLGPEWNEQVEVVKNDAFCNAYKYQLKGFRKNFQTILFYYYWKKTGSPELAMEMVCKKMKHSSRKITFQHYIENINSIGGDVDKYLGKLPFQWVEEDGQQRLYQWFETEHSFSDFIHDNNFATARV